MKPARIEGSGRREVVRGVSEQVIRVRVPVPGVFREAVFFLYEEYLRRGDLSREELLRQAMAAAEGYLRPCGGEETVSVEKTAVSGSYSVGDTLS